MSDDDGRSDGWASFVGGAAGLGGAGYAAEHWTKHRIIQKIVSPQFAQVQRHTGNTKAALQAVGLPESLESEVAELVKHPDVVAAEKAVLPHWEAHEAHVKKAVAAITDGKAKSVVFVAGENGTHTAQITLHNNQVIELKGIKTLPEGVTAGKPIKGGELTKLAKTMTATNWLEEVTRLKGLSHGHVTQIVIKQGRNGQYIAEFHLTNEGAQLAKLKDGKTVLTRTLKELPAGIALPEGGAAVLEGERLARLTAKPQLGALASIAQEAVEFVGDMFKPLRTAVSKAAGFGFGFKSSGMAGKAGIVGAAVVGAGLGAMALGSMLGGGGHRSRIEAERRQLTALTDPSQVR